MGNWEHVVQRYQERIRPGAEGRFAACLKGLYKKMKAGTMANQPWYRPVMDGSLCLGYILGQGVWVSSIFSPDMAPYGVKI